MIDFSSGNSTLISEKKMVENAVNSTLISEKKIVWKYKIRGKSTLIYEEKKNC